MMSGKVTVLHRNNDIRRKINTRMPMLVVAVVLGFYVLSISFHTMPVAEGWYTWYSKMINEGEVVYKDFSYLFFPLYIELMALFTRIFGYSIFALRILGAVLFIAIGLTSYGIFSRLSTPLGGALAAIATTIYLQSEVVQIFYDYIRVMDLFAYLGILFLVRYMESVGSQKGNASIIWCAVFFTCACMVKQSTGMLLLVYTVVLLLFLSVVLDKQRTRFILRDTALFIGTAAVIFLGTGIWLLLQGALGAFFENATGNAIGAKGGLATVLFRWWGTESKNLLGVFTPALVLLVLLYYVSKNLRGHCTTYKKHEGIYIFATGGGYCYY